MEINQDLIMQFGLMQKLSTGNSMLDALLVMLLPIIFSKVVPYLKELWDKWERRVTTDKHTRQISYHYQPDSYYYYSSDTPPNHKLQTEILLHLNNLPGLHSQLVTAEVKLVKGMRRQQSGQQEHQQHQQPAQQQRSTDGDTETSDDDSCWYPDQELEEFEINLVPPMDTTITVEPGLRFWRSQERMSTADGKSDGTNITFTLESNSAQQIDDFISAAYDSYRAYIKAKYASTGPEPRYLYLPVLTGEKGAQESGFTFRAYQLSDDKDFDNLFHPDKEDILRLVEAFTNKTGKFAIKGYPQKLGFLLHGPPGTGKTSFIKALAAHTRRSILNIPLSRIRTNQQLMSLMMDQQVRVEGEDWCRPLPHDKVIYVCEDVDAASHVVQKRRVLDPIAAALCSLQLNTNRPQKTGLSPTVSAAAAAAPAAAGTATVAAAAKAAGPALKGMSWRGGDDELNLAGLLNVLDGVVDTPGRLLVLSTNHPEMLDPALIRPGRINRQVYMGHMATREALQMVVHYFGDITPAQQEVLAAVWCDNSVSPAALEALCAECETVDSLIQGVQVLMSHAEELKAQGSLAEELPALEDAAQCNKGIDNEGSDCTEEEEGVEGEDKEGEAGVPEDSATSQAEGLQGCADAMDEPSARCDALATDGGSSRDQGGSACAGVAPGGNAACIRCLAAEAAKKRSAGSSCVMVRASSCFAELQAAEPSQ